MSKSFLSERDVCTKYITPALERAGWDKMTQLLEEVTFTDGKIYVRGKLAARGARKRADYILYYKPNIPIAIIEAKDNKHSVRAGIQQALEYANILDIPFVFSSNGDGFIFHDKTSNSENIETELDLNSFPSPDFLWSKFNKYRGIVTEESEKVVGQDYYFDGSGRSPRYYQQIAVNRLAQSVQLSLECLSKLYFQFIYIYLYIPEILKSIIHILKFDSFLMVLKTTQINFRVVFLYGQLPKLI